MTDWFIDNMFCFVLNGHFYSMTSLFDVQLCAEGHPLLWLQGNNENWNVLIQSCIPVFFL